MSEHKAIVRWQHSGGEFLKGKYSREHTWTFDGGLTVPAAPSPANVPAAHGNPANVDPEEAFVAAISSCHMLTFLFLAYHAGFQVDAYEDAAVGQMEKNESGRAWISHVTLCPKIVYGAGKSPTTQEEAQLHHEAHEQCIIANSVKTEVVVNGA
jgi:organic hydroperoxide reductase OsmC/OhrA